MSNIAKPRFAFSPGKNVISRGKTPASNAALSAKIVDKFPVLDADVQFCRGIALKHPIEKLPTDLGKERLRQDCIHHSSSALELCASAGDQFDHRFVTGEWDSVGFRQAILDSRELQPDDRFEHVVAEGIVRNYDQTAKERGRKYLEQRLAERFGDAFR